MALLMHKNRLKTACLALVLLGVVAAPASVNRRTPVVAAVE